MQRWYQPCMQEPKPRKEAEEVLSGCGGEEGEAGEVVRAPTIHKGVLVFERGDPGRVSASAAAARTNGEENCAAVAG
ncbi:hypothetical protein E2562_005267 [Oryza meyeriana var. granulata]|uniref:Uncharacterized protein n=1 Tax=Oryza meyeriana var. granulata TaxID=110450 RepID=A0A6G1EFD8_9ORYZ|nr:hypothetical protein E2562_005267 [Oryza meyeriana var. granulata]